MCLMFMKTGERPRNQWFFHSTLLFYGKADSNEEKNRKESHTNRLKRNVDADVSDNDVSTLQMCMMSLKTGERLGNESFFHPTLLFSGKADSKQEENNKESHTNRLMRNVGADV